MSDSTAGSARSSAWKWWVTGLLLLATMLNYMDRQTLASVAKRITDEFALSQEQYGNIEFAFGWGFAAGSLVFGLLADRISVRVLYPAVVLGWSAMGLLSGFSRGYGTLLMLRALLGFFEAGQWPCALKTTSALLFLSSLLILSCALRMEEVLSTHSHAAGREKVNSLTLKVAGESAPKALEATIEKSRVRICERMSRS